MPTSHLEKSDEYYFCCRIFVAALLSEVARRSRDGGSLTLMKFSLPQSASLTAPPEEEPIITFADSVSLRLGHATAMTAHRTVVHYRVDTSLP